MNNLRVLKYLKHTLGVDEAAKTAWYKHWVEQGLEALEAQLARSSATGRFCHGDTPTIADLCLVPQVANAQRMGCDLSAFPRILRIHEHCNAQPAFQHASPARQPDATP
ncbi:Maleylpyruvate isomerase [compost metagenome]